MIVFKATNKVEPPLKARRDCNFSRLVKKKLGEFRAGSNKKSLFSQNVRSFVSDFLEKKNGFRLICV